MYFTLNGVLTVWIWGVEKGMVFRGEIEHGDKGRKIVRACVFISSHLFDLCCLMGGRRR